MYGLSSSLVLDVPVSLYWLKTCGKTWCCFVVTGFSLGEFFADCSGGSLKLLRAGHAEQLAARAARTLC